MENRELATEKYKNCLKKEDGQKLILAIKRLALAKNISLMDGTLEEWLLCVEEDVSSGRFNVPEFIRAIHEAKREKVFNRLDYADFYEKAESLGKQRKLVEETKKLKNNLSQKNYSMPEEIKKILKSI